MQARYRRNWKLAFLSMPRLGRKGEKTEREREREGEIRDGRREKGMKDGWREGGKSKADFAIRPRTAYALDSQSFHY